MKLDDVVKACMASRKPGNGRVRSRLINAWITEDEHSFLMSNGISPTIMIRMAVQELMRVKR
jgi:hypothetical protein